MRSRSGADGLIGKLSRALGRTPEAPADPVRVRRGPFGDLGAEPTEDATSTAALVARAMKHQALILLSTREADIQEHAREAERLFAIVRDRWERQQSADEYAEKVRRCPGGVHFPDHDGPL